jgi:spore coat protein U-like protein
MMLVPAKWHRKLGAGFLALVLLIPLQPQPASAATATTTFAVTATVLSFCTIAALPLAFGNYSTTAITATTTIAVTCTNGTTYNVGLDAGTGTGSTTTTRKMTNGTATLNYSLFRDSAHTQNWGNIVGTDTESGTGSGLAQTLTAYGQIPANQFVTTGAYTDTITATITY